MLFENAGYTDSFEEKEKQLLKWPYGPWASALQIGYYEVQKTGTSASTRWKNRESEVIVLKRVIALGLVVASKYTC